MTIEQVTQRWNSSNTVTEELLQKLNNKFFASTRPILVGDRILAGFLKEDLHDYNESFNEEDFICNIITFHIDEIGATYLLTDEEKSNENYQFPILTIKQRDEQE